MLATSETNGYTLFDVDVFLEDTEYDLYILQCLGGLDDVPLETLTIDNLIAGLRNTFFFHSDSLVSDEEGKIVYHAANVFLRKHSTHLVVMARRLWRWHKIASYEKTNG